MNGSFKGMKVKLKNFTNFPVHISDASECESFESSPILWKEPAKVCPSNTRCFIGELVSEPDVENGCNSLLWIYLSFSGNFEESICIKIRFRGYNLHKSIMHTISSLPFGHITPQQDWHSGYAKVLMQYLLVMITDNFL